MELWRAQAGAGKTEAIVTLIAETVRRKPLARIWVVLPNSRLRAQFRSKLLEKLSRENLPAFNVELFNFYSLNRRLLGLLHVPVKSLRGGARQAVLRRVVSGESLSAFGPVAATSGFSRAVGLLISELKQARVEPKEFVDAAQRPHDEDLARLYDAYQSLLREHHLVDTEGEAWLALDSLLGAVSWDAKIGLFAVDGFDQFTEVQAQMIRALGRRAQDTVVTLTTVEGREDGVGRRFASAQSLLNAEIVNELIHSPHPQPAVRHLLEHGFRYDGSSQQMDSAAAQALTFLEAHSPSAEAAGVMREIKRRIVIDHALPDEIMVVLRDWARYQPALAGAASEFGIPISLQSGASLSRHPLGTAMIALLTLPESDYAFDAVIDVLRSPYIALEGLSPELLAKVEQAARKFKLRAGRDAWDVALDAGARPGRDYQDRETPPILSPDERDAASGALRLLFDALPHPEDTGVVWNFVERVESLIGADPDHETDVDAKLGFTLEIAHQVRHGSSVSDDLSALHAVKDCLRNMLLTEDLLAALTGGDRSMLWRDFMIDFSAALADAELGASPDRSGRVLITTANDARGSAHKHIYILGLSEGIFPAPLPNDPLYLNSERAKVISKGRTLLRSTADRADDDSIFFELVALARESLTVSRPSMNGGQAWPPSALWNGVTALLAPADFSARRIRITPGRPPAADAAASLPELAAALSTHRDQFADFFETFDPGRTAHVDHVRRVERIRYALAETGLAPELAEHVGDLSDAGYDELIAKLRRQSYPWSASTINNLGMCAYRVFAEKLLRLEELEDASEGMNAALEGSLMHRILEATYRGFQSPDRPISPENLDRALSMVEQSSAEVFQTAEESREFVPGPIWEHQQKVIVRFLQDLIVRDFSEQSPISEAFGSGRRWTLVVEKKFGDDRPVTLTVPLDDGPVQFQLTGSIDRVDCVDTGDAYHLVVVDYKRGGDITTATIAQGRDTQVVLYTAALQALLIASDSPERTNWFRGLPPKPIEVVGGLYWSMRSGRPLHIMSANTSYKVQDIHGADALRTACMKGIASRIANVRAGDFRPLPPHAKDGKCGTYCTYSDLCRVCELMLR